MIWAATLAARLLSEPDDVSQASRLAAAASLPGADGATAYLELCRLIGEAADPAAALSALDESDAPDAATMVGQLIMHCFAAIRADYPAQPDAVAARMALSMSAQSAYPAIGDVLGHDALDFVVRLVGQTVIELSTIAARRSPLVRVETGISLPSSLLAWDLYGDPERGGEIMGRNRSATPMLMPVTMQALAR
nr:hypothetical protein [Mesorhizobium sp.]